MGGQGQWLEDRGDIAIVQGVIEMGVEGKRNLRAFSSREE
jgi:hypothetical protein